jgi:hypothetical protein
MATLAVKINGVNDMAKQKGTDATYNQEWSRRQ